MEELLGWRSYWDGRWEGRCCVLREGEADGGGGQGEIRDALRVLSCGFFFVEPGFTDGLGNTSPSSVSIVVSTEEICFLEAHRG